MKLKELLIKTGLNLTKEETIWNIKTFAYEPTGKIIERIPSCHSNDKQIIKNHIDDELPFFIILGPISIFAIKIPTNERYAYFTANSIGISSYEISRYGSNKYNQEKFSRIKTKLLEKENFYSEENEEFKLFHTLKSIAGE